MFVIDRNSKVAGEEDIKFLCPISYKGLLTINFSLLELQFWKFVMDFIFLVMLIATFIGANGESSEVTYGDEIPCNPPMDKMIEYMEKNAKNPVEYSMFFCKGFFLYGLPFSKRAGDVFRQELIGDPDECHVQSLDIIFRNFTYSCECDETMVISYLETSDLPLPPKPPAPMPAMGQQTTTLLGIWEDVHLAGKTRVCKQNPKDNHYSDVKPVDCDPGTMKMTCDGSSAYMKAVCADNLLVDHLKKGIGEIVKSCVGQEIASLFLDAGEVYQTLSCDS